MANNNGNDRSRSGRRPKSKRRNTAHLIAKIRRIRQDVAKARDELCTIHQDLTRDIEVADAAVEDLDRAIETLSKYL